MQRLNENYKESLKILMDLWAAKALTQSKEANFFLQKEVHKKLQQEITYLNEELDSIYNQVHHGVAYVYGNKLNTDFVDGLLLGLSADVFTKNVLQKQKEACENELKEDVFLNIIETFEKLL